MASNEFFLHFWDLMMKFGNDFVPFYVETVHLFYMGMLYLKHLPLVSFFNFLDFVFLNQLFECLDFSFATLCLHILTRVLILFLFDD